MDTALSKLDAEKRGHRRRSDDLGSTSNEWAKFLTKASGIAFVLGIIPLAVFACLILGRD